MLTIWKFNVPVKDRFTIDMPAGTEFLETQAQGPEQASLWAIVDSNGAMQPFRFRLFGTGHAMPTPAEMMAAGIDLDYVGTFQLLGGELVYHLFEEYDVDYTIAPEAEGEG